MTLAQGRSRVAANDASQTACNIAPKQMPTDNHSKVTIAI